MGQQLAHRERLGPLPEAQLAAPVPVQVEPGQGQGRGHQRLGQGGEVEAGLGDQGLISRLARLSAADSWIRRATSMAAKASAQGTRSPSRPRQAW